MSAELTTPILTGRTASPLSGAAEPALVGRPIASDERATALGSAPRSAVARPRHAGPWRVLLGTLVLVDALALALGFGLAYVLRFKLGVPLLDTPPYSGTFYSSVALWAIPAWLALFAVQHLYDRRQIFGGSDEYVRVVQASTAGVLVVVMLSFLYEGLVISRGWLLLTWVLAGVLVCLDRFAVRRMLRALRRRERFVTPALIVGANEEGRALAAQLMADRTAGTRLLGFVDADRPTGAEVLPGLSVLGGLNHVEEVVRRSGAAELVLATTALSREQLLDLYRRFGQDDSVELRLSSGLFEILTTGVRVREVGSLALITPQRVRITGMDAVLKGVLDYALAAVALVVLSPVILGLAILVRLDSPGGAFHRRRVLGVSGKPFDAFKLRTMVVDADKVLTRDPALRGQFEAGYKLPRDPRVTRVGQFLRKTSLDELPQLLNVLRGEMSLVGPRMIAPDEAPRYGQWQLNLLTVKPGITGPWQVEGRSDLPYAERVRLSMQYIRNWSLWLDLEILLRTILVVLRRSGAY